jgi:hypothetical protein
MGRAPQSALKQAISGAPSCPIKVSEIPECRGKIRMLGTLESFSNFDSPLVERFGLAVAHCALTNESKVVEPRSEERMLTAEHILTYANGTSIERLGLGILVSVSVEFTKITKTA